MYNTITITKHEGEEWCTEWIDTGHGSGITNYIRKATPLDHAITLVAEELNKELK